MDAGCEACDGERKGVLRPDTRKLGGRAAVLTETGGRVAEFVNPKYADAEKVACPMRALAYGRLRTQRPLILVFGHAWPKTTPKP